MSVPSTLVTASQSVVDQCGLYSVDVVPMNTEATTHNVAAALISAVSGSSILFTIHTKIVDPQKLQAAREQQALQKAQNLLYKEQIAKQMREKELAEAGGSSPNATARGGKQHNKGRDAMPTPSRTATNVFDEVEEDHSNNNSGSRHSTPTPETATSSNSSPRAAAVEASSASAAEALSSPNSVTVIKGHEFYDEDEIMITQNALVTYTVKRSLEHFVWFSRQLSEKEPFLLFGELPTSLAAAYADPLKTANQITAMIMFFVRSKLTASDPFLWSLLTSPDDDFQAQYNSLVGWDENDQDAPGGVARDLIAATDFIASTQESISGLTSGTSSIAPLRWNFSIGNSWSVGSPFEGKGMGGGLDDGAGEEGSDVDEEESKDVKYVRKLEKLLQAVDQDEFPLDVIKRTRDRIQRAGLPPMKSATTLRFEREQKRKVRREKKTQHLISHINEKLTLPDGDIKPEQISKGMVESGMIDRAFFSCDKLNVTTASSMHFQHEILSHDKQFYAWGDALDAAYRLKVAMEDLAAAQEAIAPALRDLCDTNYWPWTKEKVFEEELKPKLSPRVHTSHRLTHYAHRIANIHQEVARIEKSFVSDGLISSITLGAMLYSGHRWSCAIAHQRLHRGNKIDPALRHAVLGLDQYQSLAKTRTTDNPGVKITNTYAVNEMKKMLLNVPPIFVQAVRTSLTPTAQTTGRSLVALQKDLKTIFELGRGITEADMLDAIDDDTSDIQDQLDTIIATFSDHFKEIRHDALYANVAQYLRELSVFLKFSWMSAELAIRDAHKGIDEDLFMDLGKEDLTFVMQKKTDPMAKFVVPPNFKVKEYESANTMIQQFRQALEKSRATLSLGGAASTSSSATNTGMIRDHVQKQGGGYAQITAAASSSSNSGTAKKPFMAPTLYSPFDMPPPPPPSSAAGHRTSLSNKDDDAMGEEMRETTEEEFRQREFLRQMAELQTKQKNQHLMIEHNRLSGHDGPGSPLVSTLTDAALPSLTKKPSFNSRAAAVDAYSSPVAINKSIFASSEESMNINVGSAGNNVGSVGSAGTKKRRFGRAPVDKDDPFA